MARRAGEPRVPSMRRAPQGGSLDFPSWLEGQAARHRSSSEAGRLAGSLEGAVPRSRTPNPWGPRLPGWNPAPEVRMPAPVPEHLRKAIPLLRRLHPALSAAELMLMLRDLLEAERREGSAVAPPIRSLGSYTLTRDCGPRAEEWWNPSFTSCSDFRTWSTASWKADPAEWGYSPTSWHSAQRVAGPEPSMRSSKTYTRTGVPPYINPSMKPVNVPAFRALRRPLVNTGPLNRATRVNNRLMLPGHDAATVPLRGREGQTIREIREEMGLREELKAVPRPPPPPYPPPPPSDFGSTVQVPGGGIIHDRRLWRRGPPHRWERDPRRNIRTKKIKVSGPIWKAFSFVMNILTETADFIESIWKSLPQSARHAGLTSTGNRRVDSMLSDIFASWDKVNWDIAIYNMIENQVEDFAIGTIQRVLNDASLASGPGFGTTMNKMAEHGGVNPYSWLSDGLGQIRQYMGVRDPG